MIRPHAYIVTGGAGFIGSNLVAELMRRDPGCHIVIVDSFRSGSFANIVEACGRAKVRPFRGEVLPEWCGDFEWPEFIERSAARAVFHLAAITDTTVTDEREMVLDNLGGFWASMETSMPRACGEVGIPLVYASSAAVYGTPAQTAKREPFPLAAAGNPNNVYGFSKWLMEGEHQRFASQFPKAHVVGLRYFNVFGPGEARKGKMASMVYQLAGQVLAGKPPRVFADGSQSRDQVYVDDVVDCTLHASGLFGGEPTPGVYNLGSGVATSFNDIIAGVRDALGEPSAKLATDYFEMPAAIRAFYQDWTLADMSHTQRGLGWKPSHRPADAIRSYASWLGETPRGQQG